MGRHKLHEYYDYLQKPARENGSEFITQALEYNLDIVAKRKNKPRAKPKRESMGIKMQKEKIQIRAAAPDDAGELLKIYEPYVRKTAITFEYDVPELEEFRKRIENTLKKHPYLAAERDGELLGYAYTGPFKERAAYDRAVETTIYLKENQRKMGVGRKLYQALEDISRAQNILNLNACIGYPEIEDEYLTRNSVQFHEHLGYTMVGKFHKCGYKFGNWYDMVWMEKIIGEHNVLPAPVIHFPRLGKETLRTLGVN